MILVGITVFLILIGLGFFAYGAIALSKYAFRLGTGPGLLTLLFPPYTIYFALFKLEEEDKSWPTASWFFGIIVAALLCVTFWPDLSALMRGDMERFEGPSGAGASAAAKYGKKGTPEEESAPEAEKEEKADDSAADEEKAEGAEDGAAEDEKAEGEAAEGEGAAEGEKAEGEKAEGEEASE